MCTGLANGGYIPPKEEKKAVSLIKPYTNFDRIKEMRIDEMAEFLEDVNSSSCTMICSQMSSECDYANLTAECRVEYCKKNIIKWLEREAK